mmetsp:Transcript_17520/g.24314  ORF Transcript_17520/g.24314 Transcript_17520/m.24314 type:complete len:165 (+) Transcript_17520:82-576(+)
MKIIIYTNKNLASYLARGWSEEKLISGKVSTLDSRRFVLDGLNPDDTILILKQKIEDAEGIPVEKQQIRKLKKVLYNEDTLSQHWVADGATLLLLVDGEGSITEAKQEEEQTPAVLSTRIREPTTPTKVITIEPQDEEKLKEDASKTSNWWDNSRTSGPQNKKS